MGRALAAEQRRERPEDQEEGLWILQGPGHAHRLQGREPAAQVHLRPQQDPGAAGDEQLHSAPAGHRHGDQELREMALLPYSTVGR